MGLGYKMKILTSLYILMKKEDHEKQNWKQKSNLILRYKLSLIKKLKIFLFIELNMSF